jgi:large conductance mechanosensitive channel
MLQEFKDFINKGNVMDMAVGIIIGAAFTAIVGSLVADLINPIIGIFMGGIDFAGLSANVGDAELTYGNFIMAIINFLVIAFVVFMLVRQVNKNEESRRSSTCVSTSWPDTRRAFGTNPGCFEEISGNA